MGDARVKDRGDRPVNDCRPGDGQLARLGAQSLADYALLESVVFAGVRGTCGSGRYHPVAQGEDCHVIVWLDLCGFRSASEQGAHVLVQESLEPAWRLEALVLKNFREPLGERGKVGGHCLSR
jgi:hypothetical protein